MAAVAFGEAKVRRHILVTIAAAGVVLNTVCVESGSRAASTEPARVALGQELVRVGAGDGYALHNVINVFEDPAGRLVVVQLSNPRVPVFNAHGDLITVLGGPGGGPGKFSYPGAIGSIGDSIWITDPQLRKAVVFGPDLKHVRDVVLPPGAVRLGALGSDDRMIAYTLPEDRTEWLALDGTGSRVLYTDEAGKPVARFEFEGRNIALVNPFRDANPVLPIGGSLDLLALDTSNPRIRLLQLAWIGDTLRDVMLPVAAQPVTDSWYDEEIGQYMESLSTPATAGELRATIQSVIPRPAATHALTRLVLGPDTTLWFGQHRQAGSRWHAVDVRTGHYLGFVDLTGRSEVKSGTREYVWVLEFDANDVQNLVKRPVLSGS